MLSEEEKKLLKIFKAQVEQEETEYFSVNAYTQLLYDSHKTVLNLITKLQKENEEKDKQIKNDKELKKRLCKEINQVFSENEKLNEKIVILEEKINNITQRLNNKIEKLKQRISKMHPASDCVIIEELEIKLQVLEELLKESKGENK